MARFHEAFIFLARGADAAIHTLRDNDLVNTVVVPAPDATAAAAVAVDLTDRGLDLIELYGGFGPTAAAEVIDAIDGRVPVGLVGVDEVVVARHRAVIFHVPGADPAYDRYVHEHDGGSFTIVAAPDPTAVPSVAEALVAEGADRIELCGGLGTLPAAATIEAVGNRVPVRPVLYGFESMPGVAAYRARFEAAVGD